MTDSPRLTLAEMRERFNAGNYHKRMLAGEFTQVITRNGTPKPEILRDYGNTTRSLEVSYRDRNNQEVARVHQYVDPDGVILYWDKPTQQVCRNGDPDPLVLLEDGVLYHLAKGAKG